LVLIKDNNWTRLKVARNFASLIGRLGWAEPSKFRFAQLLMLRRFNTGYEDGKYSVPAGHVESGEPITKAMVREAFEEVGIKLDADNLKLVHTMHRPDDDGRIGFFFATNQWEGEPINKEPHKCDGLGWFSVNSLPPNTIPYIRTAIEHISNNIASSEFNWGR